MGIKMTTQKSALNKYVKSCIDIVTKEIIRSLSYLGELSVNRARDRSSVESWIDQTCNLRSSIGYAIFNHGLKEIESSFPVVLKGNAGPREGQKLINQLASLYSSTYALVVVAGMSYAEYVEARDNKDVLASTELWAKAQLKTVLNIAKNRAEARIAALKIQ